MSGEFLVAGSLLGLIVEDAEQPMLPGLGIALRFLRPLHRLVEHGHELRATPERIHRAGT